LTVDGKPDRKAVQKAVAKGLGKTFVKGKGKLPNSAKGKSTVEGRKPLEQILSVIGGAFEE